MSRVFAGARIRAMRKERGLTQVEMARKLGFSTSYLNQLENDHRPLTVTTLMRLMSVFDVPAEYFSGERASRTATALQQSLSDALGRTPALGELSDFATRFPDLAQDMLTMSRLASARSAAPEPGGPPAAQEPSAPPHELVRDFFHANANYFDAVDREAEALSERLPMPRGERADALRRILESEHGITVTRTPVAYDSGDGHLLPRRVYDATARNLRLRGDLTRTQATFEMAMQLAFLRHGELLRGQLDPGALPTADSMELATFGLAQYFAAAVVLPYAPFIREAEKLAYDIDQLKIRFGAGFETIAQRLSTLQRPGMSGVPLFLLRSDRAGNISKRQSATAFHFSRHGGSCPLWVLHRAFDQRQTIVRQVSSMPDGRAYLWIARTVAHPRGGFGVDPTEYSIGLGCDLDDAHRLVYSRGLELNPDRAVPIGPGCATCPRTACMQRAFPPAGTAVLIDENVSPSVPYGHAEPGTGIGT